MGGGAQMIRVLERHKLVLLFIYDSLKDMIQLCTIIHSMAKVDRKHVSASLILHNAVENSP